MPPNQRHYYKLQTPALFESWRRRSPTASNSRSGVAFYQPHPADGEAIGRFCAQGYTELGDGPILWQFMPTKQFERDDSRAFSALLPTSRDGIVLRHALRSAIASAAANSSRSPAANVGTSSPTVKTIR